MKINNIVAGAIGVMVAVVMIAGAFLPAINAAIDDQHEYYNNTQGIYSSVLANEEIEISLTYDSSFNEIYTVNGATVDLINNYTNLLLSTNSILISAKTGTGAISNDISYYNGSSVRIQNVGSITATLTKETVQLTYVKNDVSTDIELDIDWGFYANTTGGYRCAYMPWEVYINNIDQLYGASWLVAYSKFFSFNGDKVICDGVEYTAVIDAVPVSGVTDVYKITQLSYDLGYVFTYPAAGSNYDVGPYSVIVPVEIEGDVLGYSDAIVTMFNILPIIGIAGLVMAGIYVFISRKS